MTFNLHHILCKGITQAALLGLYQALWAAKLSMLVGAVKPSNNLSSQLRNDETNMNS